MPTAEVLGVRVNREHERAANNYRWGIVPSWAKDLTLGNKAFNAQAERAAEAPMLRAVLAQRRLLVPADAYYEWQELTSGKKQPYAPSVPMAPPSSLPGCGNRGAPGRRSR